MKSDQRTADAFATSWNNLPAGSVYTREQYADWMAPLTEADIRARDVLELGCGNGSLLLHTAAWKPRRLVGVDLGSSVETANANLQRTGFINAKVMQADLTRFESDGFDLVYCIGVLHHLQQPETGFTAVLRNVRPSGRFHCWVYAREGNGLVVALVEPIRKIASRLPWWFTKYLIATPLAVPFYLYAKALRMLIGTRAGALTGRRCGTIACGSHPASFRSSGTSRSTNWSLRKPRISNANRSKAGWRRPTISSPAQRTSSSAMAIPGSSAAV